MAQNHLFDIDKAFFIIESTRLDDVKNSFYGYTMIDHEIIDSVDKIGDRPLTGEGAYIYISRPNDSSDTITITQDFIGSFGLYLFKDGDYFALSNSFIYLLEHIKKSHKLSFNQDYANHMFVCGISPTAYSETLVNEIEYLDRSAILHIDIPSRQLTMEYRDYGENTIAPDSEEGMAVLDKWFHKWTGLIRSLKQNSEHFQFDLSGGFDSRMVINLLLGANIDMSDVYVNSNRDSLHTHSEDFEIATTISQHYGFPLNHRIPQTGIPYSPEDSINISYYTKLGFHTQMAPRLLQLDKPLHSFCGNAGEALRSSHWSISEDAYVQESKDWAAAYGNELAARLEQSTETILRSAYEKTREKFRRFGRVIPKEDMTMFFYRETRCRNHFGRDLAERFLGGVIRHCPLLDPDLHKLKLTDSSCSDKNLLTAIMFDRYNPDLLKFKFDSNRSIHADTIQHARELNQRYPYTAPTTETIVSKRKEFAQATPTNTEATISGADFNRVAETLFYSVPIKNAFCSVYGQSAYDTFQEEIQNTKYRPLRKAYTAVAIAKVLLDIQSAELMSSKSLGEAFVNMSRNPLHAPPIALRNSPYLEHYITARIDFKNRGSEENALKFLSFSDLNTKVWNPDWMFGNGQGYLLESQAGTLDLTVQCIGDGELTLSLKSRNVPDQKGRCIPFWIDYRRLCINGQDFLQTVTPVWHDAPYSVTRNVSDGEVLHLHFEWEPHNESTHRLGLFKILSAYTSGSVFMKPVNLMKRVLRKIIK